MTGTSYEDLVRTRILTPLGMRSSEGRITTDVRTRLAVGYERLHDDGPPDPADPLVPAPWVETATADGCIAATARDLAAFARLILNEGAGPDARLLSRDSFQLMTRAIAESGGGWSYGYGLEIRDEGERRCFRHGGSMPGFAATMLGDLDSGLAAVALLNGTDEYDVTEDVAGYALDLQRAASGEGTSPAVPADPVVTATSPDEPLAGLREDLAPFPGRYRSYNPWLAGFRVVRRGKSLAIVYPRGQEEPLTRLPGGAFRVGAEWSPERLRFDAVVEGRALRANLSGADYYRVD